MGIAEQDSDALKKCRVEKLTSNETQLDYTRVIHPHGHIERGSVLIGKKIIWGFPHIKRIFSLRNGVVRNFPGATQSAQLIYAEEKIDGFNVRVASVNGKVLAFSRGGFLDLFVTEKVRDMGFEKFFDANPNYVLCAEMIGNTPHTRPTRKFDVKLFVFDIDQGDGNYLPCAERYSLLKAYGIESVPFLGTFKPSDYKGLKKTILALHRQKKEGMVLKSADRREVVKYVTAYSDIEDIAHASRFFFDMPAGFFHQRVLRSAFFTNEFGAAKPACSRQLGKAFYDGLGSALISAGKTGQVGEEFEIQVKDEAVWADVKRHAGHEIRIEELWRKPIKIKKRATAGIGQVSFRIRFRKIYRDTSKVLTSYLNGKAISD